MSKHRLEIDSFQKFILEKSRLWLPAVSILEIGAGERSLFEEFLVEWPLVITALERDATEWKKALDWQSDPRITYLQSDLFDFKTADRFDLIVDAHSLHFSIGKQIEEYLQKVDSLLSAEGTFLGEVMTYNKGLEFALPYYFDTRDYILYKLVDDAFVAQRSILTALMWEEYLLKFFKIEYFYIDQGLCFDLPKVVNSKVSLLKFICKKK